MSKSTDDIFAVVEMRRPKDDPNEQPMIHRIIRTYLSSGRASEDLELLREAKPDASFDTIAVQYIDD